MAGTHDVARAAGMKDTEAKHLFSTIVDMVKGGQRVLIKDFGTFEMKHVKERTITSPQIPGGSSVVPAHNVIKFRASPATKAVLNGEAAPAAEEEQPAEEAPKAKPVAAKPAAAKPANGTAKPAPAKPAAAKPAPAAAPKAAAAPKPNAAPKKAPPPPAEDEAEYDGADAE